MVILYIILFFIIFSYILKKLVPHIIRYIIKKNLEKFQKPYNKKEPKKDFKFKSKKKVGEYIDSEEIDYKLFEERFFNKSIVYRFICNNFSHILLSITFWETN